MRKQRIKWLCPFESFLLSRSVDEQRERSTKPWLTLMIHSQIIIAHKIGHLFNNSKTSLLFWLHTTLFHQSPAYSPIQCFWMTVSIHKTITWTHLSDLRTFSSLLAGLLPCLSLVFFRRKVRRFFMSLALCYKTKCITSGDLLANCSLKCFWEEMCSGYSRKLYCRRNMDSKGINNAFLQWTGEWKTLHSHLNIPQLHSPKKEIIFLHKED